MDIVVTCCIRNKDALLMVKEAKSKAYGLWNFPSGKLEPQEDIFKGAIREVKEETDYDIRLTGLLTVHNCIRKIEPILRVVYNAEIISSDGNHSYNKEEISEIKWILIDDLLNMIDKVRNPDSALAIIGAIKNNHNFPLEITKNIIN